MPQKGNHKNDVHQPLTVNNFFLVFREFVTAWLNEILYYNRVYDPLIFDDYKAFEILIHKNRHPHLSEYIDDFVLNVINNLIISKKQLNGLQSISCSIYDTESESVVKVYTIKFTQFIVNLDKTITELKEDLINDTSASLNVPDLTWREIHTQFQTVLFKHSQQLKKDAETVFVSSSSSSSSSSNLNSGDTTRSTGNNFFFKITVDLDALVYPKSCDWVRLEKNLKSKEEVFETTAKLKTCGELDLSVLSFDLVNTYFSE